MIDPSHRHSQDVALPHPAPAGATTGLRSTEARKQSLLFLATVSVLVVAGIVLTARELAMALGSRSPVSPDTIVAIAAVVALCVSMVLDRVGWSTVAVSLAIWAPTAAIFVAAIPSPSPDDLGMLLYLVIPLFLAGTLLRFRGALALAAGNTVGIVLLIVFLPTALRERIPLSTVATISAISLVATFYRGRLEKERLDRQEESEARFHTLIAHAPDAIVLFEGHDTVVDVNERALDLLGCRRADLLGTGFPAFALAQSPENRGALDALEEGIARALAGEEPAFDVVYHRGEQGKILCEARLVRLPSIGQGLVRGSFTDVTTRRQTESRLVFLATHDPLTRLPNRHLFEERLSESLSRARRTGQHVVVAFLDIDDFRTVNEALGHAGGDHLLRDVAARLGGCLRETDTVARRGGDEFSILLENVSGRVGAVPVLWKLLSSLSSAFMIDAREIYITVSVGVALFPLDGLREEHLMQNAEAALHQAKTEGKSTYRFFAASMTQPAIDRLSVAARLRHALDRNELSLHYQPQVEVSTGRVLGFESLMRWKLDGQMISPAVFIPVAEETGLIVEIGAWALRTACAQLAILHATGRTDLRMSVNISGRQLRHGSLVATIMEALGRSNVPSDRLLLELTENILFQEGSGELLRQVHSTGAGLAVDDFGTGYTTLWQLPRFPLEEIKIDKRFADGIAKQGHDDAIVAGIVGIGNRLGLRVVAEGVEELEQLKRYAAHGCDVVQGYFYSRPCPAEECAGILSTGRFAPLANGGAVVTPHPSGLP